MTNEPVVPRHVLPMTMFVLLTGSAVFFGGSAAAPALATRWGLSGGGSAALTWAVQLGFVFGTLTVAGLDVADRWPAGRLIAALLVASAVANAALVLAPGPGIATALRFAAGALAGPVYPIGMRHLATWYPRLGPRLGTLLAAYTFGAGIAFVLQAFGAPWTWSLAGASVLALAGAACAPFVLTPGPRLPRRTRLDLGAARKALREPTYRWSSFGYYGHMWELFALWGLAAFWLRAAGWSTQDAAMLVGGMFVAGAGGCWLAGRIATRKREATPALASLAVSGACCLASPWVFNASTTVQAIVFTGWGAAVVADSPMFSALSAEAAPPAYVGSALTLQNGIGFALTAVSLAVVAAAADASGSWRWVFWILVPGPMIGAAYAWRLRQKGY